MQQSQRGNLRTLHSFAYPGAHLLTFQLMQEASIPGPKVNYKPETFYFLTIAPGAGTGAKRTYDFSNKINIKFGTHEILALSFALHCAAVGNFAAINGYSKFARSTETKSVSISIAEKQTKFGNQRQITVFISAGSQKLAYTIDSPMAEAMSMQLEMSAKEATRLEFVRISGAANYMKPPSQQPVQGYRNGDGNIHPKFPTPQQVNNNQQQYQDGTLQQDFSNILQGAS